MNDDTLASSVVIPDEEEFLAAMKDEAWWPWFDELETRSRENGSLTGRSTSM